MAILRSIVFTRPLAALRERRLSGSLDTMGSSAFDLARGLLAHTLTCDQVRSELSSQTGLLDGPDDLVHFLEHFVADQDIRERDRDYAKWQEAELRKMLVPGDGS